MFWTMGITALCTTGIGFYLRFMIALCRECRPSRTGYWMLVRVHSQPEPTSTITIDPQRSPASRAA